MSSGCTMSRCPVRRGAYGKRGFGAAVPSQPAVLQCCKCNELLAPRGGRSLSTALACGGRHPDLGAPAGALRGPGREPWQVEGAVRLHRAPEPQDSKRKGDSKTQTTAQSPKPENTTTHRRWPELSGAQSNRGPVAGHAGRAGPRGRRCGRGARRRVFHVAGFVLFKALSLCAAT